MELNRGSEGSNDRRGWSVAERSEWTIDRNSWLSRAATCYLHVIELHLPPTPITTTHQRWRLVGCTNWDVDHSASHAPHKRSLIPVPQFPLARHAPNASAPTDGYVTDTPYGWRTQSDLHRAAGGGGHAAVPEWGAAADAGGADQSRTAPPGLEFVGLAAGGADGSHETRLGSRLRGGGTAGGRRGEDPSARPRGAAPGDGARPHEHHLAETSGLGAGGGTAENARPRFVQSAAHRSGSERRCRRERGPQRLSAICTDAGRRWTPAR
eukprot:ctg_478.g247